MAYAKLKSNHAEPLLLVISGPSGVGKDSVLDCMKQRKLAFHFVITATSRSKRPGEIHGRDYFFLSKQEFEQMINQDELLEYAIVYEDYKGIPKAQVRQAMKCGKDVVMRIDVQGAATIRKLYPGAVTIFLNARDETELIQRLITRKSETTRDLDLRVATARLELQRVGEFDYVVQNLEDQLERTVDIIEAIICAEHHRVHQRKVNL